MMIVFEEADNNVDWIEGIGILIAVLIVVLVTAVNDWTKEKQFRDLQAKLQLEHKLNVVRDSAIHFMPAKELLVGDILLLTYGNIVPADGILIESKCLKVDESVLTGESELIKKHASDLPVLYNSKYFYSKTN